MNMLFNLWKCFQSSVFLPGCFVRQMWHIISENSYLDPKKTWRNDKEYVYLCLISWRERYVYSCIWGELALLSELFRGMALATPTRDRQGTYPTGLKVPLDLNRDRFGSMRIITGRTRHESRDNSIERLEPLRQEKEEVNLYKNEKYVLISIP